MPDPIFENERLVQIYDVFDGPRQDLDSYCNIVAEFAVQSILDVGAGTGCLSTRLAGLGYRVTALDPAKASLDYAKAKPHAKQVRWIHGTVSSLDGILVDMALMTGNVAQVFLEDSEWSECLISLHQTIRPGGYLVFEARNPSQKSWTGWTRENTYQIHDIENVGLVEGWCDLKQVSGELVSFEWSYRFHSDGILIQSQSTLRFRERDAIVRSLSEAGFKVLDIRDAPDRPDREFVFIAQSSKQCQ